MRENGARARLDALQLVDDPQDPVNRQVFAGGRLAELGISCEEDARDGLRGHYAKAIVGGERRVALFEGCR